MFASTVRHMGTFEYRTANNQLIIGDGGILGTVVGGRPTGLRYTLASDTDLAPSATTLSPVVTEAPAFRSSDAPPVPASRSMATASDWRISAPPRNAALSSVRSRGLSSCSATSTTLSSSSRIFCPATALSRHHSLCRWAQTTARLS